MVKSDGPAHKARSGGVVLGIETADGAAEAARRLGGSVLVARQVDPGAEVLCGMTRDADFGPILAVGRGGVAVEELDSVHLASAPAGRRRRALTLSPRRGSTIHTESSPRPRGSGRSRARTSANRRPWRSTRSSSGRLTPWQSTRSSSSRIDRGRSLWFTRMGADDSLGGLGHDAST